MIHKFILLTISLLFMGNCSLADNSSDGYYLEPNINKNKIIFVTENDLWETNVNGGIAQRVTNYNSEIHSPILSPDNTKIAFSGSHEGNQELYILDLESKKSQRITHYASKIRVLEWMDNNIYFSSNHSVKGFYPAISQIYCYNFKTKNISRLPFGLSKFISHKDKIAVIQRNADAKEFGYWKNYKGGAQGDLWISFDNYQNFKKLIQIEGNLFRPLIIKERVYFLSDHEGNGSIYSVNLEGKDLKLEIKENKYYIRNISTDGDNIIYTSAGEIYVYNPQNNINKKIPITLNSNKLAKDTYYNNYKEYVQHWAAHPQKDFLAQIIRGKAIIHHYYNGQNFQIGQTSNRYNLVEWLEQGKSFALVAKHKNSDTIEIYDSENFQLIHNLNLYNFGRIINLVPSNSSKKFAVINLKGEVIIVDYNNNDTKKIDKSEFGIIADCNWSKDDQNLIYSIATASFDNKFNIKLFSVRNSKIFDITNNEYRNYGAVFSDDEKYVFFLSDREYSPYREAVTRQYIYPFSFKPYLATLNHEHTSPFTSKEEDSLTVNITAPKIKKSIINLKNITNRALPMPLSLGIYNKIFSFENNLWFLVSNPMPASIKPKNSLSNHNNFSLIHFDLEKQKTTHIIDNIEAASLIKNGQNFIIKTDNFFRCINSMPGHAYSISPPFRDEDYNVDSGWINNNFTIKIDFTQEWEQIFQEAFLNLKERFYNPKITNINFDEIYHKYHPLLSKINSRLELNDLLWEFQGEMKTSHAYVMGGDYNTRFHYPIAMFGCEFVYDQKFKAYRVKNLAQGDLELSDRRSPFLEPGINILENDLIYAINHQKLDENTPPEQLLLNIDNNQPIVIEAAYANGKNRRQVTVNALDDDYLIHYSEWVKHNKKNIYEKTEGKVGYIHIPNMAAFGYNEFHRYYLQQFNKEGLIIDARFNSGGHASGFILDKLTRNLIGFFLHRSTGNLSYPDFAPTGKMVLLVNEYCGSDGDILAQSFKTLKLGPVIGKRTWGGIIGIDFNAYLQDGGMTTQPEYPIWLSNDKLNIENYGVNPDIEVDITPNDYINNRDPQLDKAIEEILKIVNNTPLKAQPLIN